MDDTVSGPVRQEPEGNPIASSTSNKIVEGLVPRSFTLVEFRYLLEKSQQLFVGLSAVLENKDYYDLKRWEIGELASKIGQLYHQYYTRTSETNYLNEAFTFYDAIRERNYFRDVMEAKNAQLMVKKLRYMARFMVVALLLNKADVVKKLADSLTALVEEYNTAFQPSDSAVWKTLVSEISTFLEAEKKISPIDGEGVTLTAATRIQAVASSKFDKDGHPRLKLQEAILVCNYQNQIKFAELTLDAYRMMQSLEREPSTNGGWSKPTATASQSDQTTSGFGMAGIENKDEEDKQQARRNNPRKYPLYRNSFAQITHYIATCFKDVSENSAMLVYLSADGSKRQTASTEYSGGVATAINITRKSLDKVDQDENALVHTLHPQDLVPFSRKPMFVIVDSNNSTAFNNFTKVFNQPFACFMSPVEYPSSIKDITQIGNLFTLFLHCPIKALAFISDITQLNQSLWSTAISHLDGIEKHISELMDADQALGGFSPHNGIVLCENQLESKSHLEDTLAHELVHAFDQASVKNMDWTSLKVQACTEIRAVNLSGECRFTRELRRGHFGVAKHHQECVKRRAVLGVMQSANLKDENGRKDAERAVLNVWNDCFPDTAPFDEIF
ncbi:hypothetical protein HDV03_001241 [Kappamyces sp. JEL0829]|nr:hypothetical protein HDV03_001241 [Kappamyces sp. JEL0829]